MRRLALLAAAAAVNVVPTEHPRPGSSGFPTLLSSLVVAEGVLDPPFSSGHFEYDCHVRSQVETVTVVLGLNFHLYNPRHLPMVSVDYKQLNLNPLQPVQATVELREDETERRIMVVLADPVLTYRKTMYSINVQKAPNHRDMTLLADLYAEDENGTPLKLRPPFDPRHRNSYHASTTSRYIFWYATCMPEASLIIDKQEWVNGQYYPIEVKPLAEGRSTAFVTCDIYDEAGDKAMHPYMLSASVTKNTTDFAPGSGSPKAVKLIMLPQDGECHWMTPEKENFNETAALGSPYYECTTGQLKARFLALFDDKDVEVLLRHKHNGHRAAPLKHRLYQNVPTFLPTPYDMELVLAVIAGESHTETTVHLKHHWPRDETLDMVFIHVALHLGDGTCITTTDANHVRCVARRHHVRFTVHWTQGTRLTDGLSGTLKDNDGHEWKIDYGIASEPVPLSTTAQHFTERHFELVMKTPYSAPRTIFIHVVNQGPNMADSFGGDVLNDVELGPHPLDPPLESPQLV